MKFCTVDGDDSTDSSARKDSNGVMDWLDGQSPWSFILERYPELIDSVSNKFDSLHKTGARMIIFCVHVMFFFITIYIHLRLPYKTPI